MSQLKIITLLMKLTEIAPAIVEKALGKQFNPKVKSFIQGLMGILYAVLIVAAMVLYLDDDPKNDKQGDKLLKQADKIESQL